jgi:hypothetical protein
MIVNESGRGIESGPSSLVGSALQELSFGLQNEERVH